jgi:dolichol-phosphate mannosyltransferase
MNSLITVPDNQIQSSTKVALLKPATISAGGLSEAPEPLLHVAVVIPAYRVEEHIADVIDRVPSCVGSIIVVEDKSPDSTGPLLDELVRIDARLIVIHHEHNCGVGGATKSGYSEALKRGADIVVKLDGDGQMRPDYIESLVSLIVAGDCDYAKGNRFQDWSYLRSMPFTRKVGNLGLSFMIKLASGYWNVFDPTNGFTAVSAKVLRQLDFGRLEDRFLFESSMLVELYRLNVRIKQIPMPAVYNGETSSLSVWRSLIEFPLYLLGALIRRFIHRYIWQDFTAVSLFVIVGVLSILFGVIFGGYQWIRSLETLQPATAGTVMLSAMPVILGFQLLLQAVVLDIENVPK